jgi:hypothetical protein
MSFDAATKRKLHITTLGERQSNGRKLSGILSTIVSLDVESARLCQKISSTNTKN